MSALAGRVRRLEERAGSNQLIVILLTQGEDHTEQLAQAERLIAEGGNVRILILPPAPDQGPPKRRRVAGGEKALRPGDHHHAKPKAPPGHLQ